MSCAADPEDLMDSQAAASPAFWVAADTCNEPNAAIANTVERKRNCFIAETPLLRDCAPRSSQPTGAIVWGRRNWTMVPATQHRSRFAGPGSALECLLEFSL